MLYLVEGLNCSGKTTYINSIQDAKILHTPWLNPLRWQDKYKKDLSYNTEQRAYIVGAYEGIYRILSEFSNQKIFFDRTWISAYAYGSIEWDDAVYLSSVYAVNNTSIVFIDTSAEVCWDRWNKLRDKNDKSYVINNFSYWEKVYKRLSDFIKELSLLGYLVNIIKR